jgi:hypothetical protein
MYSGSELSSFAARLRRHIQTCAGVPHDEAPDFNQLALELFALQFEHNIPYRRLCEARNSRPETLHRWTEIPAAPTSAFKQFDLSCLPAIERTAVFHSSGTTTQRPSRHFHNAESLALYEASLWVGFTANFKLRIADYQLVILTPPPAVVPHSSLVHMFEIIRGKLGADAASFVGAAGADGSWSVELDAAVEGLGRARTAGQPVLLLGTAFMFVHLLDQLEARDLRFELPPGSCALETGGYKGRSRSLPKAALHAFITQRLGIALERIVCEYGMSELSSQAYDCAVDPLGIPQHTSRRFHFPPWALVQIISADTGREVGEGQTGLIRVFDLANVWSVMAIQTEDLGTRCGQGFVLAGRGALAEPRGCSLMAV